MWGINYKCAQIVILVWSCILLAYGIAILAVYCWSAFLDIYKSSYSFTPMKTIFIGFGWGLGVPWILISIVGILIGCLNKNKWSWCLLVLYQIVIWLLLVFIVFMIIYFILELD